MSTTNYDNTTTNAGTYTDGYDKTTARGGYRDESMGTNVGQNNQPAGGVAQSNLPADEARVFGAQPTVGGPTGPNAYTNQNAPLYGAGETAGDAAVGGAGAGAGGYGNQHHLRHDAEGAALGGVAGHEYAKHHDGGPGAGTGAAVGAVGGHEYNEHHQHHGNRVDTAPQSNATAADHRLGTAGAAAGAAAVAGHEHHKHHHEHNQGNPGAHSDFGRDPSQGYGNSNLSAGNAGFAGNRVDQGPQSNATAADHHLGTAGAAGAVAGHEYNKHHHNNQGAGHGNTDTTTIGTNNSGTTASGQTEADAKSLQRSGKIDKIVGTLLGSTSMKEKGLQKQADAAAIRSEVNNNDNYANTTSNAGVNDPNAATGVQPSYATGEGAPIGGRVGGGVGREL